MYPLLIALLSLLIRNLETAGRIVSLLTGLGLIVAVFSLAKQLYGERAAMIAGSLVALFPVFVMLSGSCYSEATYVTLLLGGAFWGAGHCSDPDGRPVASSDCSSVWHT